MEFEDGIKLLALKVAEPAFWIVSVFPAARLKLLPLLLRLIEPPSIVTSPLALKAPVFAPLPMVTVPVLLIEIDPVPVVSVPPVLVVPILIAAGLVEALPMASVL